MTAASTHPPFDPELSATLAALPPELQHPLLPEDIPAWREQIGLLPGWRTCAARWPPDPPGGVRSGGKVGRRTGGR